MSAMTDAAPRAGVGFAVGSSPRITRAFIAASPCSPQFWTPYDPGASSIVDKLQAPNLHHWFGTDQLGRDVLSMIMAGAKNSVGVALLSVIIGVMRRRAVRACWRPRGAARSMS